MAESVVRRSFDPDNEPKNKIQCERCGEFKKRGAFKLHNLKSGKRRRGLVCRAGCEPIPTNYELMQQIKSLNERVTNIEAKMY